MREWLYTTASMIIIAEAFGRAIGMAMNAWFGVR
jgi:hypothetical protein